MAGGAQRRALALDGLSGRRTMLAGLRVGQAPLRATTAMVPFASMDELIALAPDPEPEVEVDRITMADLEAMEAAQAKRERRRRRNLKRGA